ncbi:hypothetical protein ACFX5Q_18215 [Mesorhizobium sp. IMUNJ 23033]|uniref:hypothetical protein n=1 Tax=Mesorhizobium sp. IMUNJ 23033 TaxID=3378039 RepID=UPI00384FA0DD
MIRDKYAIIHHRALDFWAARGAVLVIICLQLLVINDLSFGPRWLAPALEAALLHRLFLPGIHQRDGFLTNRHHAADSARQTADDGGSDDLASDHRARRGARG